jgi:hypothetical protein
MASAVAKELFLCELFPNLSMRKGLVYLALLFASAGAFAQSGKEAKAETLARWHFVGTKQLSDAKDLPSLRDILALKESEDLRNAAIDGFAMHVAGRFTKTNQTNINAQIAALIKPLLPDIIQNESRFELAASGAQHADWSFALKLPPEHTAEWHKNLSNLAESAHMKITPASKGSGWSAQQENYHFTVSPTKDWLILDGGFGQIENKSRKAPKSGGKELLTAEINCPAIAKLWNAGRFQHAPKLTLNVEARKGKLRSEMLVDYPQSLNITPEPWNVPTDLIRDPLIGFTAIQGIGPTLAENPQFKALGAQKTPNQAFFWSQSILAFTVFTAADVGNPATVLKNLEANLPAALTSGSIGAMTVLTNRPGILWRGLPVITPFLEAGNDGKSPYLVAGLFPANQEKAKPAPPELFAQLKKQKNLVYYDWEITQERLKQWRPIWQAAQIVRGKSFGPSASDRWIEAITPKLQNTITEAFLEGPNRLKLVRNSQSGLSALELVLLAHALDPNDVHDRPALPAGQQPVRRKSAPPKR